MTIKRLLNTKVVRTVLMGTVLSMSFVLPHMADAQFYVSGSHYHDFDPYTDALFIDGVRVEFYPSDPGDASGGGGGEPVNMNQTCPDGSVISVDETCPPTTKVCPDGSTVDIDATCPPTTKTCWDGSIVNISATCPVETKTCPDGSVVAKDSACPVAPTCNDRSASNYGGALPCTYPPKVCADPSANNYGGTLPCTYNPVQFCSDPAATNYGSEGTCTYPPVVTTCQDRSASNYGGALPCTYPPTCSDPKAENYGSQGTCTYPPEPAHTPSAGLSVSPGTVSPGTTVTLSGSYSDWDGDLYKATIRVLGPNGSYGDMGSYSAIGTAGDSVSGYSDSLTRTFTIPDNAPPGSYWFRTEVVDSDSGTGDGFDWTSVTVSSPVTEGEDSKGATEEIPAPVAGFTLDGESEVVAKFLGGIGANTLPITMSVNPFNGFSSDVGVSVESTTCPEVGGYSFDSGNFYPSPIATMHYSSAEGWYEAPSGRIGLLAAIKFLHRITDPCTITFVGSADGVSDTHVLTVRPDPKDPLFKEF